MRQLLISAEDCRGQSSIREIARREGMGVRRRICVMRSAVGLYDNGGYGDKICPTTGSSDLGSRISNASSDSAAHLPWPRIH